MSENRLLNSKSDVMVEVEDQVTELTVDDTDAIVKIMEDVEINLLQEKIAQLKEEKSLINTWSGKKQKLVWSSIILSVIVLSGALPRVAQSIATHTGDIALAALSVVIPLLVLGVFAAIVSDYTSSGFAKIDEKEEAIVLKRKELFEKSLKVNLVNKDETTIDEKWREVIAFDENDDYVKFLARIVENAENGNEMVEAKRLKG